MNNNDVAAALQEIAELLELRDESSFRIRAYENAGRSLAGLTEDVRTLRDSKRLTKQKGIGAGIASKIEELLDSGHIAYLDELRAEFPDGVRSLMRVPGIGPSLARRVYRELDVRDLEGLRTAAENGTLAELPGMGAKSAENVIRALSRVNKQESRISIGKALPVVEELVAQLRDAAPVDRLRAAGSLRRWSATIGDIDLMATSSDGEALMAAFVTLPQVRQVLGHGPTKSAIVTDNGLQVDMRIVDAASWGSLLQHFTGSKDHNIELREYALGRGQSLNEYGIVATADGALQRYSDEEAFYRALDLDWIPPELRQGTGEIGAARTGNLPALIALEDITGDLHVHTNWSDGSLPIEGMAAEAVARGYQYIAITDHSGGIGVAHGLSPERMLQQLDEIERVRANFPQLLILTGTELEIKRDGSLDFPDDLLARLDWVIASVHSGFNQSEEDMTARIVRAMENQHVDAIGHPTGRLIGKREPYAVNLETVFRAAARTRTALEINSFPERLDLVDSHARRAKELGARIVINTDAHAPANFDNIRYGVAMGRRGWLEASDVVNTSSASDLKRILRNALP